MDKTWYNIYKQTQEELKLFNLTIEQIQDVFNSQFSFIRKTYESINTDTLETPVILLPEIGRFYGKKKIIKRYKSLRKSGHTQTEYILPKNKIKENE